MFDYNKMLDNYSALPAYSAKTEKEAQIAAKKAAKEAEKQAKQIPATGCGNYSCRICYGIFGKKAFEAQDQNRKQAEKDVQDFMQEQRSRKIDVFFDHVIQCVHGEIST